MFLFTFLAPSKCHPNPCENGATCTDKFYYMDIVNENPTPYDVSSDVISPHKQQENDEAAIITQESSDGAGLTEPNDFHANDLSKEHYASNSASRDTIDLGELGLGVLSKKNSITVGAHHNNKTLDSNNPVVFKGNQVKNKRSRIADRPYNKYHRKLNTVDSKGGMVQNVTSRTRRDEGDVLPDGVDKNMLNIYGFYCTCLTGFKGLKCERKFLLRFLVALRGEVFR
jgi:hypothetical protein